jgi:hypothetical protein
MVCLWAGLAQASITGSAHDFGKLAWSGNQTCAPCHTPHNAIVKDQSGAVVAGPLWNHQLSNASYTMYETPQANGKTTGEVDQNSKLCLSCHDGTVALDSFGGLNGTQQIGIAGNLGTDLSDDHPIGETAIWPNPNPSYMVDPTLRTAKNIMPLRPMADGRLAVGCTSCHEPHNRAGTLHMLWVNNAGSGTTVDGRTVSGSLLCQNCHKK